MTNSTDEILANNLKKLPLSSVDSWFFRMVSPRWIKQLDSVEGARIRGGRYNPPLQIAQDVCGIGGGFGFLYTATNPVTCLFECRHILRGLGGKEPQILTVEPSLLVTFKAESDRVLDLREESTQELLGLKSEQLTALDLRYHLNAQNEMTLLQRLGAATYKIGRFSGILAPSRYSDIMPGYCFNFLPNEVRPIVVDVEKILDRISCSEASALPTAAHQTV